MKKSSKNIYKEIDNFFSTSPTSNQKAWGIINEFYHLLLSYMEENNISKAELARKLGKSRSAISQMFNKTPNITLKKMVEISDAVGLEFSLIPNKSLKQKIDKETRTIHIHINVNESSKHFIETKNSFLDLGKDNYNVNQDISLTFPLENKYKEPIMH